MPDVNDDLYPGGYDDEPDAHHVDCDGIICWDETCDCVTLCPVCSDSIPPDAREYLKSVGRWQVDA